MRIQALAVLLLLSGLLAAAPAAWGQSKVGTTIGAFLRIEPSARGAALGNAGVALPGGIESIYYNTGSLGLMESGAVQYSHSMWFADINHNYAAAVIPASGLGNFFLSTTALSSGEIDVRTVDQPLGTGERYTVSDVALGLGFGRQVTSRFAAGIQFNYVTERIWNTSYKTATINLGTMYRLSESGAMLGFCLSHLGTRAGFGGSGLQIQYDADPDAYGDNSALPAEQSTDSFPLPGLFRLGLSIPYKVSEESALLFLIEGQHPNDNSECINLGAEWKIRRLLALRLGYQTLFRTDTELGLTLGFGVQGWLGTSAYQLNYGWADHESLGDTHRLTMVLDF